MSKLRWVVLSVVLIGALITLTGSALVAAPVTGGVSVSAVHQSAMAAVKDVDVWLGSPYGYWNPRYPDWGYGPGHPWNGPMWGSQCDWRWLNGGWVCVPFNGYRWPDYDDWGLGLEFGREREFRGGEGFERERGFGGFRGGGEGRERGFGGGGERGERGERGGRH